MGTMNTRRGGAFAVIAILVALLLGACGKADVNPQYMVLSTVQQLNCSTELKNNPSLATDLRSNASFVAKLIQEPKSHPDEVASTLELNPGMVAKRTSKSPKKVTDLSTLNSALVKKADECGQLVPSDPTCPSAFVQKDISDPAKYRPIKGGIDAASPDASRKLWVDAMGHSAPVLRSYATISLGLKDVPPTNRLLTSDGKCLSAKGQSLYSEVKGAVMASSASFVQAPAGAVNSGWQDGRLVTAASAGITGNVKALQLTLPSGEKVMLLVRCGNPVFQSPPPGVPTGPTDNPPPKGCVEIPGNGIDDCHPKKPSDAFTPSGTASSVGGGDTTVDPTHSKPSQTAIPKSTYTPPAPPSATAPPTTPRPTPTPTPTSTVTETATPPPPEW